MTKFAVVTGLAAVLAFSAAAQGLPEYVTKSASGSTTSVVYFASSPNQQIRVVQAITTSDAGAANLVFKTGVTPLSITKSNASGTTIDVGYTNGFTVADFVVLETAAGVVTNAEIASFTGATNIVFMDKVPITRSGDQIYKLGTAVTLPVGVNTAKTYSGEAIFVGTRGRPVQVTVTGGTNCSLDAITARYE